MSFDDDEQMVIPKDVSSGERAPTFVAGKIQIEVINLMEAPLEETRFKVLLELKESGDIEGRHGLDLVMVIDISGSMNEGDKLDKLKIAMQFLIEKLSPVDRFSIVTFFDSSIKLFPLRQITEDSKAEIIEEIRLLNAKNSDKNIAEGLRMALKVLNDRHFTRGRVGAIMLFSDGAENRGKAATVDVSRVPVHTFGFDASHDQRVLLEIAQKSNGGTFSDLQNENNWLIAFSQWLAGLLTVVVRDLRITVAQVDGESKIMNVRAGNSPMQNENSAIAIYYGDLYGKEVRKVQVELLLPNIVGTGPRAPDVLLITCSYSDEYGKERFEAEPIFITVTRTRGKEIRREEVIGQNVEKNRYKKLSGKHDSRVEDSTEEQREIQESKVPRKAKVMMTFKELGVTAERQLVREIKEAKVDVRDSQEEFKIQRVPKIMVRNEDYLEEYFKPRELSIGPIHSADSSLFKKELKLKLAEYFITETHNTTDELLILFKAGFKDIKKHFDKDIIMSCTDDELIWLVFLDGCAMLGFIHSYLFQGLNKFHISNRQAELIRQDLLLMENQIPFTLLHALTRHARCVTKYEWFIPQFIHENSIIPKDLLYMILDHKDSLFGKGKGAKQPDHILDLYRRILLTIPHDSHDCFDTLLSFFDSTFGCVFSRLRVLIGHVLSYLGVMERFDTPTDDYKYMIRRRMHSFRNIQELKTAGIKLKPTYSLRRIFFRSRFFIAGQLSIPALVVDDSTERMLLNLVAYEMCLNKEQAADSVLTSVAKDDQATDQVKKATDQATGQVKKATDQVKNATDQATDQVKKATDSKADDENDSWVTSYVNLLDVLIDNEQDVKDLRAAGILQNHLSSDIEVAQLINRVGSNCFAPSKDTYEHVKEKIEKHYRRKCAIWMAQVCQSNFSSPWTILALFAATAVLGLTAVQTYYAVNPKK